MLALLALLEALVLLGHSALEPITSLVMQPFPKFLLPVNLTRKNPPAPPA